MAVSKHEGMQVLNSFLSEFKTLKNVHFVVFENREGFDSIYGKDNAQAAYEAWGDTIGAFSGKDNICAVSLQHAPDASELRKTLVHECIGHSGLNTYTDQEKLNILNAIIESRDQPTISDYWELVDKTYPFLNEYGKADEVFAHLAEHEMPFNEQAFSHVWKQSIESRNEPLQAWGVCTIAAHIAQGMRENSREYQIHPTADDQLFNASFLDSLKNPALLHERASSQTNQHFEALRSNPDFDNRTNADLGQLAYWRGIVACDSMLGTPEAQKLALMKFDQCAKDPAFLSKLQQAQTGPNHTAAMPSKSEPDLTL